MKATIIYSTTPLIEDHKIVLETDVPSVVGGLVDLSEELTQQEVRDRIPDNWIQATITIMR